MTIYFQLQHLDNRLESLNNDQNVIINDIICLQETSSDRGPTPNIRGYSYYSAGRGPHRGVGIFIKDFLKKYLINETGRDEKFGQFLKLSFLSFNIITVYRTHLCQRANYGKLFINTLFNLINDNKPTIISGDFNYDYLNDKTGLLAHELRQAGFSQIVKEPTTVRGNCIDHLYLPSNESNFEYKLYYPYYADHEAIRVMIKGWKDPPTRSSMRRQLKRKKYT